MGAETSVLTISPHPSHGGKLRLSEISILPSHLTPASVLSETIPSSVPNPKPHNVLVNLSLAGPALVY